MFRIQPLVHTRYRLSPLKMFFVKCVFLILLTEVMPTEQVVDAFYEKCASDVTQCSNDEVDAWLATTTPTTISSLVTNALNTDTELSKMIYFLEKFPRKVFYDSGFPTEPASTLDLNRVYTRKLNYDEIAYNLLRHFVWNDKVSQDYGLDMDEQRANDYLYPIWEALNSFGNIEKCLLASLRSILLSDFDAYKDDTWSAMILSLDINEYITLKFSRFAYIEFTRKTENTFDLKIFRLGEGFFIKHIGKHGPTLRVVPMLEYNDVSASSLNRGWIQAARQNLNHLNNYFIICQGFGEKLVSPDVRPIASVTAAQHLSKSIYNLTLFIIKLHMQPDDYKRFKIKFMTKLFKDAAKFANAEAVFMKAAKEQITRMFLRSRHLADEDIKQLFISVMRDDFQKIEREPSFGDNVVSHQVSFSIWSSSLLKNLQAKAQNHSFINVNFYERDFAEIFEQYQSLIYSPLPVSQETDAQKYDPSNFPGRFGATNYAERFYVYFQDYLHKWNTLVREQKAREVEGIPEECNISNYHADYSILEKVIPFLTPMSKSLTSKLLELLQAFKDTRSSPGSKSLFDLSGKLKSEGSFQQESIPFYKFVKCWYQRAPESFKEEFTAALTREGSDDEGKGPLRPVKGVSMQKSEIDLIAPVIFIKEGPEYSTNFDKVLPKSFFDLKDSISKFIRKLDLGDGLPYLFYSTDLNATFESPRGKIERIMYSKFNLAKLNICSYSRIDCSSIGAYHYERTQNQDIYHAVEREDLNAIPALESFLEPGIMFFTVLRYMDEDMFDFSNQNERNAAKLALAQGSITHTTFLAEVSEIQPSIKDSLVGSLGRIKGKIFSELNSFDLSNVDETLVFIFCYVIDLSMMINDSFNSDSEASYEEKLELIGLIDSKVQEGSPHFQTPLILKYLNVLKVIAVDLNQFVECPDSEKAKLGIRTILKANSMVEYFKEGNSQLRIDRVALDQVNRVMASHMSSISEMLSSATEETKLWIQKEVFEIKSEAIPVKFEFNPSDLIVKFTSEFGDNYAWGLFQGIRKRNGTEIVDMAEKLKRSESFAHLFGRNPIFTQRPSEIKQIAPSGFNFHAFNQLVISFAIDGTHYDYIDHDDIIIKNEGTTTCAFSSRVNSYSILFSNDPSDLLFWHCGNLGNESLKIHVRHNGEFVQIVESTRHQIRIDLEKYFDIQGKVEPSGMTKHSIYRREVNSDFGFDYRKNSFEVGDYMVYPKLVSRDFNTVLAFKRLPDGKLQWRDIPTYYIDPDQSIDGKYHTFLVLTDGRSRKIITSGVRDFNSILAKFEVIDLSFKTDSGGVAKYLFNPKSRIQFLALAYDLWELKRYEECYDTLLLVSQINKLTESENQILRRFHSNSAQFSDPKLYAISYLANWIVYANNRLYGSTLAWNQFQSGPFDFYYALLDKIPRKMHIHSSSRGLRVLSPYEEFVFLQHNSIDSISQFRALALSDSLQETIVHCTFPLVPQESHSVIYLRRNNDTWPKSRTEHYKVGEQYLERTVPVEENMTLYSTLKSMTPNQLRYHFQKLYTDALLNHLYDVKELYIANALIQKGTEYVEQEVETHFYRMLPLENVTKKSIPVKQLENLENVKFPETPLNNSIPLKLDVLEESHFQFFIDIEKKMNSLVETVDNPEDSDIAKVFIELQEDILKLNNDAEVDIALEKLLNEFLEQGDDDEDPFETYNVDRDVFAAWFSKLHEYIYNIGNISSASNLGQELTTKALVKKHVFLVRDLRKGILSMSRRTYNEIEDVSEFCNIQPDLVQAKLHEIFTALGSIVDEEYYFDVVGYDLPISVENLIPAFVRNNAEAYKNAVPKVYERFPEKIDEIHILVAQYLYGSTLKQRMARGCSTPRNYAEYEFESPDPENDQVVRYYEAWETPSYLVLEYQSDFRMRKQQVDNLGKLLFLSETEFKPNYPNYIMQMIMASGKSSVFNTMLSLLKADGYHLSVMTPPASLFESNSLDLYIKLMTFFKQTGSVVVFNGNDPRFFTEENMRWVYESLKKSINRHEFVMIAPHTIQTILNKYVEALTDMSVSESFFGAIRYLRAILRLFYERGAITMDEVDMSFVPNKETNTPLAAKVSIIRLYSDIFAKIFYFIATELKEKVNLREDGQVNLNEAQFQEIRNEIGAYIVRQLTSETYFAWRDGFQALNVSEDQIAEMFNPDDTEAKKWMQKFAHLPSNDHLEGLVILRRFLFNMLPKLWKLKVEEDYGMSHKNFEMLGGRPNDKFGLARPYKFAKTPSETSEFSSWWEVFIKTLSTWYSMDLDDWRYAQKIVLVFKMQWKETESDPLNKGGADEILTKFEECTGWKLMDTDHSDQEKMEEFLQNYNTSSNGFQRESIIDFFMRKFVLPQVQIYLEQITNNPQNMVSIFQSLQGYSGTVENKYIFPHYIGDNFIPDEGANGSVMYTILQKCNLIHRVSSEPQSVYDILSKAALDMSGGETASRKGLMENLRAIIDIGAYFKKWSNAIVADGILTYYATQYNAEGRDNILGVLYFNEVSNQMECLRISTYNDLTKKSTIELSATDRASIEAVTSLKIENLFSFYDQRHITGTDIVQIVLGHALVFISEKTVLRDIFQGVMRMRKFKSTQSVSWVMPEYLLNFISEKVPQSKSVGEIGLRDILGFAEINSVRQERGDNFQVVLQKIFNSQKKKHLISSINFESNESILNLKTLPRDIEDSRAEIESVRDLFIRSLRVDYVSEFCATPKVQTIREAIEEHIYDLEAEDEEELMEILEAFPHVNDERPENIDSEPGDVEQIQQTEVLVEQEFPSKSTFNVLYEHAWLLQTYDEWKESPSYEYDADSGANLIRLKTFPDLPESQIGPYVFSLSSVLTSKSASSSKDLKRFRKFSGFIEGSNMYATTNFLTCRDFHVEGDSFAESFKPHLFSLYSKFPMYALVLKLGGKTNFVLLSLKEAAYFKDRIEMEDQHPLIKATDARLIETSGKIIAPRMAWPTDDPVYEKFKLSCLVFSGSSLFTHDIDYAIKFFNLCRVNPAIGRQMIERMASKAIPRSVKSFKAFNSSIFSKAVRALQVDSKTFNIKIQNFARVIDQQRGYDGLDLTEPDPDNQKLDLSKCTNRNLQTFRASELESMTAKCFGELNPEQFDKLTASLLHKINPVAFGKMTREHIDAMNPRVLSMFTHQHFRALPPYSLSDPRHVCEAFRKNKELRTYLVQPSGIYGYVEKCYKKMHGTPVKVALIVSVVGCSIIYVAWIVGIVMFFRRMNFPLQ